MKPLDSVESRELKPVLVIVGLTRNPLKLAGFVGLLGQARMTILPTGLKNVLRGISSQLSKIWQVSYGQKKPLDSLLLNVYDQRIHNWRRLCNCATYEKKTR